MDKIMCVFCSWTGGAAGLAVQIPVSYALGDAAPTSKPRMDGECNLYAVA